MVVVVDESFLESTLDNLKDGRRHRSQAGTRSNNCGRKEKAICLKPRYKAACRHIDVKQMFVIGTGNSALTFERVIDTRD